MTREEFVKGWVFLTAQPWGKRYAGTDGTAMVQSELYYKKFSNLNSWVWLGCCEMLAAGEHWPSIDELRLTIRNNTPQETRISLPLPLIAPEDFYPRQVVMAWKDDRSGKDLLYFAEQYLQPFLDNPKYNQDDKDKAVDFVVRLKDGRAAHAS